MLEWGRFEDATKERENGKRRCFQVWCVMTAEGGKCMPKWKATTKIPNLCISTIQILYSPTGEDLYVLLVFLSKILYFVACF